MLEIQLKMRCAQTQEPTRESLPDIFARLEETRILIEQNPKISVLDKKQMYMQINNSMKNMYYKLNMKREAGEMLAKQLEIIGDNEVAWGTSLTHIYQDLALIHHELGDYLLSNGYCDQLIESAQRSALRNH